MAQSDLTVHIDDDLKTCGEALLRSAGMNWSTAFSTFISYSVKLGKFPFEADGEADFEDSPYNPEVVAELLQARSDLEAGRLETTPWRELRQRRIDAAHS
ncbi:MAG: hypothetical protein FWG02_11400 [Holophagaceae bacterium]|nr:hypothetical protein [Holophagaceae bacterium]